MEIISNLKNFLTGLLYRVVQYFTLFIFIILKTKKKLKIVAHI